MRCRKCNAELMHNDYEKCPYCGEIIHNHEMYEHKEIIKCKKCNATITDEYDNCPYCNHNVKENNYFLEKLSFLKYNENNNTINNKTRKPRSIIFYIIAFIIISQIISFILTFITMFLGIFLQ